MYTCIYIARIVFKRFHDSFYPMVVNTFADVNILEVLHLQSLILRYDECL